MELNLDSVLIHSLETDQFKLETLFRLILTELGQDVRTPQLQPRECSFIPNM